MRLMKLGTPSDFCTVASRSRRHRVRTLLSACLSGLALFGCAQTTDYVRPSAPVAAQWPGDAGPAGGRVATKVDWREFFSDPRLQVLIATALMHNRDLRIAIARVEEARAQYGIIGADRFPTVNLNTSRAASGIPTAATGSTERISTQRYDANLGVAAYEIDFWGRVSGQTDSALASFLATEEARRAMQLTVVAEVANAYFVTLEMDDMLALTRATIATREKTLALFNRGRQLGNTSDYEYHQMEGLLAAARAGLAALERQRAIANNLLTLLVGTTPEDLPPARPLVDQELVNDLAADIPSEVLLSRPDVMAAEQRLISAHASIGAARAAFLPKILLTATMGLASRSLATLFQGAAGGAWSFQPMMNLPIFDAGRIAGNVDIAEARKVIAVADYEKTIQTAFREVSDLLASRAGLLRQREAMANNLRAQEERLRIAQGRFAGGVASYLEVLDAQRDFFGVQQTLVQLRREQLVVSSQLYKALGGGQQP
jgi:multidrug efflux system outer membrane protein